MLKPIRIRDRKAPRFRWSKGRYTVLNRDLFDQYQSNIEHPIKDFKIFKTVIEDFHELVKQKTIENRDGVKLPAMMGILAVCSYKPKDKDRQPVDWSPSTEAGVKLKEYNLHTAGLACKIVYSIYTAKYKFRSWALWKFEGNRDFKSRVSNAFIKDYQRYKRMDNKTHISKIFKDDYVTKKHLNDSIRADIQHTDD